MKHDTTNKVLVIIANTIYVFSVAMFMLNYDIIWKSEYVVNNRTGAVIIWLIATTIIILINSPHRRKK